MLCNADNLKEWTGITQDKRLIKWLDDHHILWFKGQGGQPCTTYAQINACLSGEHQEVEFE